MLTFFSCFVLFWFRLSVRIQHYRIVVCAVMLLNLEMDMMSVLLIKFNLILSIVHVSVHVRTMNHMANINDMKIISFSSYFIDTALKHIFKSCNGCNFSIVFCIALFITKLHIIYDGFSGSTSFLHSIIRVSSVTVVIVQTGIPVIMYQ